MWQQCFLGLLLIGGVSRAEEVDQFSSLAIPLRDSRLVMNTKVNELIGDAIDRSNAESRDCRESTLYHNLQHNFSFKNQLIGGVFNKWIVETPDVDRLEMKISSTIYGSFPFLDAPFFRLGHPDSREIQVGKFRIGTDKVDHFFSRGYKYFLSFKNLGRSLVALNSLLQSGLSLESGLWGQVATGVFSYGDLAANYHGLRFWNAVLADPNSQFDALAIGPSVPYVSCQHHRWVQVRDFDWNRYIDDSWDETVNCNLFAEKSLVRKIRNEFARLSLSKGQHISCPMQKDRLVSLYKTYSHRGLARYLVNREGGIKVYRKSKEP